MTMRGWRWLDEARGDARVALRQFRRSPGFTVMAVLTLALGIGVNVTVFAVANAVLFKGFPRVDPENRIVYITSRGMVSYPDFEDWRARATSFDDMAVVSSGGLRYRLGDRVGAPDTYDVTRLSANAFRVLGQRPILGRDFMASDEAPGAALVTILSHELWQRRYAGNPAIVGQTVRLNDRPATVIGIMAPGFDFPHHRVDLWLPLEAIPSLQERQTRLFWFAFARLGPGVSLATARVEMEAIGQSLEAAHPRTNRGITPALSRFHEFYLGSDATAIYGTMWGAVGFVLLIACANLANLLLARSLGRSREVSVRVALGAGRWRIVRQLLIESVMLSALGGLFGWLIAMWSVRGYQLIASPPGSYDQWEYALDVRSVAYAVALSLVAGVLFGLAPARRLSKVDIGTALKDGGRGASGGRTGRLATMLVVAETALAVVLLAGAGLLVRSFLNFYQADIGIQPDNLLTASVSMRSATPPTPDAQRAFFDRLTTQLATVPGVDAMALTTTIPTYPGSRRGYELAGQAPEDEQQRPMVTTLLVSDGYVHTIGARLLAGREFDAADDEAGTAVALVNERFASTMWPDRDPIGQRIRLFDGTTPGIWRTVVGVTSNVVQNPTPRGRQFDPIVYLPFRQSPQPSMTLLARTSVPPSTLADTFRRELHLFNADMVVGSGAGYGTGPAPLVNVLAFQAWSKGVNGGLFLLFATLALLLASLGLYAVVAQAVSQRTQEIGIRTALGADARTILAMIFRQGMLPVGMGLAIGLGIALGLTPLLRSQLVQVSPADPLTLVFASVALLMSATLGCWIPARRATRIDPVLALRHD